MFDVLRRNPVVNRVEFDPTDPLHLKSFKKFIETGSWGDVHFRAEAPFLEVPATVMYKFCKHQLKSL